MLESVTIAYSNPSIHVEVAAQQHQQQGEDGECPYLEGI